MKQNGIDNEEQTLKITEKLNYVIEDFKRKLEIKNLHFKEKEEPMYDLNNTI